jgi:hypothetical protein
MGALALIAVCRTMGGRGADWRFGTNYPLRSDCISSRNGISALGDHRRHRLQTYVDAPLHLRCSVKDMRYRVTFMERTDSKGNPSEAPPDYVTIDVADGVIIDCALVERLEPAALRNEDQFEEDDNFLSVGSETWDYEVADERRDEFLAAVKNSQLAIDCEPIEDGGPE